MLNTRQGTNSHLAPVITRNGYGYDPKMRSRSGQISQVVCPVPGDLIENIAVESRTYLGIRIRHFSHVSLVKLIVKAVEITYVREGSNDLEFRH